MISTIRAAAIATSCIVMMGASLFSLSALGATERWEVDTPIGKFVIVSGFTDAFADFRSSTGYLNLTPEEQVTLHHSTLDQFNMGAEEWPTRELADTYGLFAIPTLVVGGLEFFAGQYTRNSPTIRHRLPETIRFEDTITIRVYASVKELRAAHSGWDVVEGKAGYFDADDREIGFAIDKFFLDEYYPERGPLIDTTERAAVALGALRRTLLPTLYHEFIHLLQVASGEFEYLSPFLSEGQATYLTSKLERQEILFPLVAAEFGGTENLLEAAAAVAAGVLLSPDEYSRLARLRQEPLGSGTVLASPLLETPGEFANPETARLNYDLAWLFFFFVDFQDETVSDFEKVREIVLNLSADREREALIQIETRMAATVKDHTDGPIPDIDFANKLAETTRIHDQGMARSDPKPLSVYTAYTQLLRVDPENPVLQSYLGDLFLQQGARDVFVALYSRALRRQSQPSAMLLGGKVRIVNRYVDALWELGLYQRVADLVEEYSFTELDESSLADINLRSAFLVRFAEAAPATRDKLECEFQLGQQLARLYALEHSPSLRNAMSVIETEGDEATREAYRQIFENVSREGKSKLHRTMTECRIKTIPVDAWYLSTWEISKVQIDPSRYVQGDHVSVTETKNMTAWDWFYVAQEQEAAENRVESLTNALELDPTHLPALINRCLANRDLDRFDEAMTDCNQAVQLGPEVAVVYNNRGWVHIGIGNVDEAIADYSRSLELEENYPTALENRAHAFVLKDELKLAEADLRELVSVYPGHPDHLNDLAWFLIDQEINIPEGIELAESAVEQQPSNANFIDTLGWGFFKAGQTEEAIRWLERAAVLDPHNVEIRSHQESVKKAVLSIEPVPK